MLLHNPDQAPDLTEFIWILDSNEAVQHDSALFAAQLLAHLGLCGFSLSSPMHAQNGGGCPKGTRGVVAHKPRASAGWLGKPQVQGQLTRGHTKEMAKFSSASHTAHMQSQAPRNPACHITTMLHLCNPYGKLHTIVSELDLGSYCSIISGAVFDAELSKVSLKCLKGLSYAFEGTPIPGLEGSFNIMVLANSRECSADFLIASADITPLIGQDLINGTWA